MLLAHRLLVKRAPKLYSVSRLLHQTTKSSTATVVTSHGSDSGFVSSLVNTNIIEPLLANEHQKVANTSRTSTDKITRQSFLDLNPESYRVSETQGIHKYYTSKSDGIERHPYEKEVNYLKNILESFTEERFFGKTDQILKSLSKLVTRSEFTDIGNKYLESVSLDESLSVSDLDNAIADLKLNCGFLPNDRTQAVKLNKMLNTEDESESSINIFFENMDHKTIRNILGNNDVLGVDNLYKIFNCPTIDSNCIPKELHEVYQEFKMHQNDGKVVEDTLKLQEDKFISPLTKENMEELVAVDSFGLKVIRHSLLGLEPSTESVVQFSRQVKEIIDGLDDEQVKDDIKAGKFNHFEVYSKLQTDEQRSAFSEALETFNYERQKQIEIRGIEGAKEKWKHDFEEQQKRGDLNLTKGLNAQCYEWVQEMVPIIQKELEACKELLNDGDKASDAKSERALYAPFFIKVDPEKAAVITILELLKLHSTGGVVNGFRAYKAVVGVGKAIEGEFRMNLQVQQENKLSSSKNNSPRLKNLIRETIKKDEDEIPEWDNVTRSRVGGVLVSALMTVSKVRVVKKTPEGVIKDLHPAFYHGVQFIGGQRVGVIKVHAEISKLLTGTSFAESVQPQYLPMLIRPKPWTSFHGGGSLFSKSPLVRMKDAPETEAYVKAASKRGNLDQVFDGLNVLGNTAWTVNKRVFDVISHYWNKGEEFLSIPPVMEEARLPEKLPADADPQAKLDNSIALYKGLREFAGNRSQRCDYNYKLEIARGFIGERLYFPHNLDFRGRAYPISPHFNHLGGDLTRSLFLFWEGKQLGEEGLRWLKVQLANVYGVDKESIDGRVKFIDDNIENVIASAKDPYAPDAWWQRAEKPWQALSVCFELGEAYQLDDPTKFVSHLPVHQDGTCNGLQHYAALGGDIEGANQVNLNPAERPQDVYSYVARLVEKRVREDAANGNEIAKLLQNEIKRKVVKQTVMTNVYGVTFVGAIQQIKKQISHLVPEDNSAHLYARYLANQVFISIRELFENAHLIQDWLTESARRITKSVSLDFGETDHDIHSSSVIWTTPLGLPCVQPYRIHKYRQVNTSVQSIKITAPSGTSQVDSRKQVAGFPPNFVHSLDATHMLMTATQCGHEGLNFASVHDSFWTHAANVPIMNKLIRQEFVKLHTTDLVSLLKEEFLERYKGSYQFVRIPQDHELANKVKALRKHWAKSLGRPLKIEDELYMEKRRLQMLESENPEEVEAAESMETTISVSLNYNVYDFVLPNAVGSYEILVPIQFPKVPAKGDFDVNLVKDSQYFFS